MKVMEYKVYRGFIYKLKNVIDLNHINISNINPNDGGGGGGGECYALLFKGGKTIVGLNS